MADTGFHFLALLQFSGFWSYNNSAAGSTKPVVRKQRNLKSRTFWYYLLKHTLSRLPVDLLVGVSMARPRISIEVVCQNPDCDFNLKEERKEVRADPNLVVPVGDYPSWECRNSSCSTAQVFCESRITRPSGQINTTNREVQMTHEPLMNLFSGLPASNKNSISTTLRTLEPDSELTSLQETPTSVSLCPPQPGRIHILRHPSVP